MACSEPASKWMYGNCAGVEIIHNGIDTQRFRFDKNSRDALRKRLGLEGKFVVGHVGRFVPVKNHAFLLEVFKEIRNLRNDAVLVLVGEGELQEQIMDAAHRWGLDRCVLVFPFQEEIQDCYSMMDVFVLPSKAEGFPLVGIEAQANGLPAICSDAVPEGLKQTDLMHFISLKKDPQQWAEGIIRMADSGAGNREDYCKKVYGAGLDMEQVVGRVDHLLASVTGKR